MKTPIADGARPMRFCLFSMVLLLLTAHLAQGQITFGPLSDQTFGAAPFMLHATASSGQRVVFSATTPATCTAVGDLVTVLGVGTCSITAATAGTVAAVTQSFTVKRPVPSTTLVSAGDSPLGTGHHPASVTVGDFNGDGKVDLAVANTDDNTLTVLLGNGSGGFAAANGSPVAVGGGPVSVVAGDFNGDGKTDLATADLDGTVTVLLGNGTGGFTAASGSPMAVGSELLSIAAGDFNGDGNADLAVLDFFHATLFRLQGDGSGGFAMASSEYVDPFPVSLAVGDFDGDGNADVAVLSGAFFLFPASLGAGDSVRVYRGNGAFGIQGVDGPYPMGSLPASLALGDYDGDGRLDLAVPNSGENSVTLLVGASSGGFSTQFRSNPGNRPVSLAMGDFDGDGKTDLATANFSDNTVSLLLATGSTLPFPVGHSPASLILADFNGDGRLDLAVANYSDNTVTVLLGSMGLPQTITFAGLGGVTFGDPPFAVSATASSGLPVTFTAAPLAVCTVSASQVKLVGPGICSITASQAGDAIYGTALPVTQSFTVSQTIAFGPLSDKTLGTTPFTLNATASSGFPVRFGGTTPATCTVLGDLVTVVGIGTCSITATAGGTAVGAVTQSFKVTKPLPSTMFIPAAGSPVAVGLHPTSVAVGDFNSDSFEDLAVANSDDGTVTILLGNGSGGFTAASGSPVAVGEGPVSIVVGDFNGDRKTDLAVANLVGTVTVLLGNGSGGFAMASGSPVAVGGYLVAIAAGDLNGDEKTDLVVADYFGNTVTRLVGDGNGGFSVTSSQPVGPSPVSLAVGDFDGDGKADLAVLNGTFFLVPPSAADGDSVTVYRGDGNLGIQGVDGPYLLGSLPASLVAEDLNGDGVLDLAVANSGDNTVAVLLGNSGGGFLPQSLSNTGNRPVSLALGDFDGDGKLDLAVTNFSDNTVALLMAASSTRQLPVGHSPASLAVGDFNGDGRQDLAVINYSDSDVTVLLGAAMQATTTVLTTTANNPTPAGQSIALTAKVSATGVTSSTATGTVIFSDGTQTIGTAPLVNGVATFIAAGLSAGDHTFTAAYGGDALNGGSTSNTLALSIVSADDLAVAALVSPLVQTGHNLTYLIATADLGPATAYQVKVSDVLPPGTTFVSASWVAGSCVLAGGLPICTGPSGGLPCGMSAGTVTCSVGTLPVFTLKKPVGAVIALVLHIAAPAGATITNTATVTGANADGRPGNNSFQVETRVIK